MSRNFPQQKTTWIRVGSVVGSCLLTALLFWIIPITQILHTPEAPDLTIREVTQVAPPPQEPPPPLEPTPPAETPQRQPELAEQTAPIEIQPLDVDISPGNADALAMGAPQASALTVEDFSENIEQLFSFDDLAEAPRLINSPRFQYPRALQRKGIDRGKVIVEIDILPDGSAELHRIVSSTHPKFIPIAQQIVKHARFTEPTVNGEPQRVRGRFPIILEN